MKLVVRSLSACAFVVLLTACQDAAKPEPSAAAPSGEAKAVTPVKARKFGAPLSEAKTVALADVLKSPGDFAGKTIKTEGEVKAVCQAAGCWMEIESESGRAHIKMANHSFFMPKDCAGKRAIVEGTVQAGEPKNECGQKDSCGGEDNGAVAKLELVATGVELVD